MDTESNLKRAGAYREAEKHERFRIKWMVAACALGLLSSVLVWPAHVLLFEGITRQNVADVGAYFTNIFSLNAVGYVQIYYGEWVKAAFASGKYLEPLWLLPAIVTAVLIAIGSAVNRHNKTPNIYGDSTWANEEDIKRMESQDLLGTDRGRLMHFGFYKKQPLRMVESLSSLLLAPPGTGKSVGFIVPSIVNMDSASLLIHDLKPELADMTSGYRERLGPVFVLKWAAIDAPDGELINEEDLPTTPPKLLLRDENGDLVQDEESGRYRTQPIFYPSWNPLSPKSLPQNPQQRDLAVERLANVLCPDPSSGGDKFWTGRARSAIVGLVHYLLGKVGRGDYEGIPARWIDREASFPMLIDWWSEAQAGSEENEDPLRGVLMEAVRDIREENEKARQAGKPEPYSQRAFTELTSLANTPDKTRGGILTTMDEALMPFRQEAVRQRTSYSDFSFSDLRGVLKPEAIDREKAKKSLDPKHRPAYTAQDWEPITIYISVSLQDARALSVISGLFVEMANTYLVAYGPNATDDHGRRLGPYDFGFLLDEAPQMPKLQETVINGPATGRSKRVFYCIVGQDFAQFETKYSKADVETLISTTAFKLVLTLNNDTAAKRLSEMAGKFTYQKTSYSDKSDGGKGVEKIIKDLIPGSKKSKSQSFEAVELLKPSYLMSLPKGKHVILVQNFMNKPIEADTAQFFKYPEIAAKVFNMRTQQGPRPAPPMAIYRMEERAHALREGREIAEAKRSNSMQLVLTPRDLRALRGTLDHDEPDDMHDDVYVVADMTLQPNGPDFAALDTSKGVTVYRSVADLAAHIRRRRILVFNSETVTGDLNPSLAKVGVEPLRPDLIEMLSERAAGVEEPVADDLYVLGHEGSCGLRPPDDRANFTHMEAALWMADIFSFVLGIEDQVRLIRQLH